MNFHQCLTVGLHFQHLYYYELSYIYSGLSFLLDPRLYASSFNYASFSFIVYLAKSLSSVIVAELSEDLFQKTEFDSVLGHMYLGEHKLARCIEVELVCKLVVGL